MYDLDKCQKIEIDQGAFYLGPSNPDQSVGYVELKPFTSLNIHKRDTGLEKLTQVKGKSSMIVYDKPQGRIITLSPKDTLTIEPKGTWHIHANPFDAVCLTYWDFEGDITKIIESIKKGAE